MKPIKAVLICSSLLALSTHVFAGTTLTTAQCNDYPFVKMKAQITHAQLMQELGELEAVGYHPENDDNDYPSDLQRAETRLQADYARDCTGNSTHITAQNSQ